MSDCIVIIRARICVPKLVQNCMFVYDSCVTHVPCIYNKMAGRDLDELLAKLRRGMSDDTRCLWKDGLDGPTMGLTPG